MLDNLEKYELVLASGSPRRKELLSGLGVKYTVKILPGIDESYPENLQGEEIPLYIACKKAAAYRSVMSENELIVTADTIVWLEGVVLGKPHDEEEASGMLRQLSGKTHRVITGVCLTSRTFQKSFTAVTEVTFGALTEEEIRYYVNRFRPLDKAGAYGIQEWIGFIGAEKIEGSFFNVMGLPVQRLYKELARL